MSNKNSISYRRVGDYNIPNLTVPPEEAKITLGKWGMMQKEYLKKHKTVIFNSLLIQGKLWQYLAQIDIQAQEMFDTLVEQMKASEGVTEELKEQNQWEWVQIIGNIQQRANEIVCNDLIYT